MSGHSVNHGVVVVVVSTLTYFYLEYEYLDGRSQIMVHRHTAPSVPWWSPIQVLTGVNVA